MAKAENALEIGTTPTLYVKQMNTNYSLSSQMICMLYAPGNVFCFSNSGKGCWGVLGNICKRKKLNNTVIAAENIVSVLCTCAEVHFITSNPFG